LGFFHASLCLVGLLRRLCLRFQFPLLGIFPCILEDLRKDYGINYILSIPFAWDFSMHPVKPLIKSILGFLSFNSLCLGFFHASHLKARVNVTLISSFNSLCLGFFHASWGLSGREWENKWPFNSLCLGFFHASSVNYSWKRNQKMTFNSLCLGFFHASHRTVNTKHKIIGEITFNSLCLGFFHASLTTN